MGNEITKEYLENMIDEKLEQKLEQKLEEKLEQKLNAKLSGFITKDYFKAYMDGRFDSFGKELDTKLGKMFDEKLANLPTKDDMNRAINHAVEELAQITSKGFEDVQERLGVMKYSRR